MPHHDESAGGPRTAPPRTATEFRAALKRVMMEDVEGLGFQERIAAARSYLDELWLRPDPGAASVVAPPTLRMVPFQPGRRPLDESLHPRSGSSEKIGFLGMEGAGDQVLLLYELENLDVGLLRARAAGDASPFEVAMRCEWLPDDPSETPEPVPGLEREPVPLQVIGSSFPALALEPGRFDDARKLRYVAALDPDRQLQQADEDRFGFARLFRRNVGVTLMLRQHGREVAEDSCQLELFHTGRFGSLYRRVLDDLVMRDAAQQAERLGAEDLGCEYHPFFPVLVIGMRKADLYMRAIHEDLELSRKNLPDPSWLVRVGLYLELLTCLGLFEAVRADYPDLLRDDERAAFETSPRFEKVRARLDVAAWREVWALRDIAPRGADALSLGPVGATNMLRKKRATLAFLHAHHEDLKQAIELSGPNHHNSQETWHRVFRDAERAVLTKSAAAFPELAYLTPGQRKFVLWHQRGDIRVFGRYGIPAALTSLFGDQDAILPSACRQYRSSMNDVAEWARERGLMDYTGQQCVPPAASLLEAEMSADSGAVAALQRRDGYSPELALDVRPPTEPAMSPRAVAEMLRKVPLFAPLMDREIEHLAQSARRERFGPMDRVMIQGDQGTSLLIVESGEAEVLVRVDGEDRVLSTVGPGAILGERGLLTGAARGATVRALGELVALELSHTALQPIIRARPQLVVELSLLLAARQGQQAADPSGGGLADQIRRFLFRRG
jgi:hypothetical protein